MQKIIVALSLVLIILNPSCAFDTKTASTYPLYCGATQPVTYKDREIYFEIHPQLNHRPESNFTCSLRLRSPFQCPHPYSIEVLEDNPEKCRQNEQSCIYHQHVYWTPNGELKVEINIGTLLPSTRMVLHVLRLDCDSGLKAKLLSNESSVSLPVFTEKLRVKINSETGTIDQSLSGETYPSTEVQRSPITPQIPENFLEIPHQMTNHLLATPGFPRNPLGPLECFFVVPKINLPTCRLRIHFRYFNLPDPNERTCDYHFLEIDNRRICGCRTGLLYLTQLDGEKPKVIRYVNRSPVQQNVHQNSIGFLLEVQQEGCPYRYQNQWRPVLRKQSQFREREPVTSGFYYERRPVMSQHRNQQCHFNFDDWLRVLQNPLWTKRQQCRAREYLQYL